jgi:twitching motility two-component system response regulator PilG
MLSGKDGVIDKVRGRLAGANEYLTKPFEPRELVRVVQKYLPAAVEAPDRAAGVAR